MIVLKEIKIRAGYPQWSNLMREVEKIFDSPIKPEILSYFTRITDLWKHKVKIQTRKRISTGSIELDFFPTGENAKLWIWTSAGTKRHPIKPKRPGYPLRFRTGYQPRTSPGYKYRGPGKSTGPWRSPYEVKKHPGTKPRRFEKHMVRFYQNKFCQHIENALRRGAARL